MEEKASCSSSNPPDEISLFLHQFLLRSSSSSSTSSSSSSSCAPSAFAPQGDPHSLFQQYHLLPPPPSADGIPPSAVDPAFGYAAAVARVFHAPSSSSVGASENEADEYDCESEEGLEALLEEIPAKPNPPRGSSKRSRTAEVHNLSEKRRRSRINEKMKALQSLIPNSNKTDKASMLDEAIEYLKQLQLQVQMLSMRNGLSLHPICMPGVLQPVQVLPQMRAVLGEENNEQLHTSVAGSIPVHPETSSQSLFGLLNQRASSTEPSVPPLTNMFTSETTFALSSSIQTHSGTRPFQLHSASEEICREDVLRNRQLNINHSDTSLFGASSKQTYSLPKIEFEAGSRETVSIPFGSHPSTAKTEDPFQG